MRLANFYKWIFFDERVYTTDSLQSLHDVHDAKTSRSQAGFFTDTLPSMASLHFLNFSLALCLLLVAHDSRRRPDIKTASVIALFAYIYLVSFVTYSIAKFPARLGWSLFLANAVFILALFPRAEFRKPTFTKAIISCAALISALLSGWIQIQTYHLAYGQKLSQRTSFEYSLAQMQRFDPEAIILIQPGALYFDTFEPLQRLAGTIRFINVGWNTFSPRFYSQISAIDANKGSEIIPKMAQSNHAYVLGYTEWIESLISNYIKPHQQQYTLLQVDARIGNDPTLKLYRVIEQSR